jgi:hypothetical protein
VIATLVCIGSETARLEYLLNREELYGDFNARADDVVPVSELLVDRYLEFASFAVRGFLQSLLARSGDFWRF